MSIHTYKISPRFSTLVLGLAMAAAARAEVLVTVEPAAPVVMGGATLTLRWQQAGDPQEVLAGCYWVPAGAAELVSTGWDSAVLTAPPTDRRQVLRVHALNKKDGRWRGSTDITVLPAPARPGFAVPAIQGFQPLVAHWERKPFWNLLPGPELKGTPFGSGKRPVPLAVAPTPLKYLAGYGCPVRLRWPCRQGEVAALLSLDEGGRMIHRNVPGQDAQEVTVRDMTCKFVVESFHDLGARGSCRHLQWFPLATRGVLPYAGGPAGPIDLGPPHRDGRGAKAWFAAPCGMAMVGPAGYDGEGVPPLDRGPKLVVADPEAHVLRCLYPYGARGIAVTRWGQAFVPGCQEGTFRQARFREPAFVLGGVDPARLGAAPAGAGAGAHFLVTDSGNHVIRWVDDRGVTRTLAGLGEHPGYQDGPLLEARFNRPQGLAQGPGGLIYVADQGNNVIRVLDLDSGQVGTLAGQPGVAGGQDGPAGAASFFRLKGLAVAAPPGASPSLYVADGNSVRHVALVDLPGGTARGAVTTVAGGPDLAGACAGSRDCPPGTAGPAGLAGWPCLDNPVALATWNDLLFIADQGNHAVRAFDTASGRLFTLAGDRDQPVLRPGLLRDDLPGPLDEAYGAIPAPAGLWADPAGEDLLVAASGCIVRISQYPGPPWRLAHRWAMDPEPGTPSPPGGAFILNHVVLAEQPLAAAGLACQARFAYRLDLLDPDGNPDPAPLTGRGSLDVALPPCRIRLSRPGTWTMVLTAVTETGHSLDWRWSWTLPAPVAADAGRPPVSAAGPA